jgi:hypothetical protein
VKTFSKDVFDFRVARIVCGIKELEFGSWMGWWVLTA